MATDMVYRVFDWDQAARLILASEVPRAEAGLLEDWFWTGGTILEDFKPVTSYTYLASRWATPAIVLGSSGPQPCYYTTDPDSGDLAHVSWPDSALAILRGK